MDSTTRLLLLRHGEVETRYHRVFGGRIDMDLSSRGHEQAKALAGYVSKFRIDSVYVSPMKRAQQTVAPLTALLRQTPTTMPDLREVDFGNWTGLTWEQVQERFQVSAWDWLHKLDQGGIAGAETTNQFRARVEPCLRHILQEHRGQSVAVVCHGGVIRMALAILLDFPILKMANVAIEYASLTVVNSHARKPELHLLNFTPWRDLA